MENTIINGYVGMSLIFTKFKTKKFINTAEFNINKVPGIPGYDREKDTKVKEDCKKDIVFYTYDPRLTGKQIQTEVPLNETTEMLSGHEFNLTTRYYRNCSLTPENRSALIKRYGNCLYTIINDLFLKV